MAGTEVRMTLEDAVAEVLGLLTGLDLTYAPEIDRFRAITRQLNRGLRATALEHEWSCYHTLMDSGSNAACGAVAIPLAPELRPRIMGDDAVRLLGSDGTEVWAYFLPRDALHKYARLNGLWVSAIDGGLAFSRPFTVAEHGMKIQIPVMREPTMFRLPGAGVTVPSRVLKQEVDFAYPDLVIARGAYFYAQTDPVMQPRVPTLEQDYKTLMYQLIERDTAHTDMPYQNSFTLPLENGLKHQDVSHLHPHADYV